jgi:hypothetical protein
MTTIQGPFGFAMSANENSWNRSVRGHQQCAQSMRRGHFLFFAGPAIDCLEGEVVDGRGLRERR